MDMPVLLGLGHFLQQSDEEMTPVSALQEIMGLGGVGGKLTTVNNCSLPASVQEKNQEEQSCTQLSPDALPVALILKSKSVSLS